jgi:hypothetical protein
MAMRQPEPKKTWLTREEMLDFVEAEVQRLYGMSLDEWLRQREEGTLPWRSEEMAIEILLGVPSRC